MRTLVIRLSALGDVVLSTAVIEYLYKKSKVDFLVYREFAEIFDSDPRIDRVWKVDRRGKNFGLLIDTLKSQSYDLIIDLQVKPFTMLLGRKLGFPYFRVDKLSFQRRLHVWFGLSAGFEKVWLRYAQQVAGLFGDEAHNLKPKIYPSETSVPFDLPTDYVILAPEASTMLKRWSFENFIKLAKLLRDKDISPVWIGRESYPDVNVGLDLRGKTDLKQVISIIHKAKLVVGNDSAIVHIAYALDVPRVVIMGPTTKSLGFISDDTTVIENDLKCRPCSTNGGGRCWRGDRRCLEIEPERVLSTILELFHRTS